VLWYATLSFVCVLLDWFGLFLSQTMLLCLLFKSIVRAAFYDELTSETILTSTSSLPMYPALCMVNCGSLNGLMS